MKQSADSARQANQLAAGARAADAAAAQARQRAADLEERGTEAGADDLLVERADDLADLVSGQHVDRRYVQAHGRIHILAQLPDPLRKLHRGDVERAFPQPAQRPDQGPGHGQRRDQHQEQDDRGEDAVEQRGLFRAPAQYMAARDDAGGRGRSRPT